MGCASSSEVSSALQASDRSLSSDAAFASLALADAPAATQSNASGQRCPTSPERPRLAQTAQQPSNANGDSPAPLLPQSPAAFHGPRRTGANDATDQPGTAALSAADGAASAANGNSSSTSFFHRRSDGGTSRRTSALLLHRRPSSSPGRRPFLTASGFFRPADDQRDSLADEAAGGAGPRTTLDG